MPRRFVPLGCEEFDAFEEIDEIEHQDREQVAGVGGGRIHEHRQEGAGRIDFDDRTIGGEPAQPLAEDDDGGGGSERITQRGRAAGPQVRGRVEVELQIAPVSGQVQAKLIAVGAAVIKCQRQQDHAGGESEKRDYAEGAWAAVADGLGDENRQGERKAHGAAAVSEQHGRQDKGDG
jgi:hypothetical protein